MSADSIRLKVLILGGTSEARELATALDRAGVSVVTALAGRTTAPRLPAGQIRVGGFSGATGLAAWIVEQRVRVVVDASHPFAGRISASVVEACDRVRVPLLRLERPRWHERPGDCWHRVDDLHRAAGTVPDIGRRVWLTIGRQGLSAFAGVEACWFLIRCIEPPEPPLPLRHTITLDRGPFTLDGELAVIDKHRIDVLVTKESGGAATEAKLEAARLRRLPVIVVSRPPAPDVESVGTVAEAVRWALSVLDGAPVRPE